MIVLQRLLDNGFLNLIVEVVCDDDRRLVMVAVMEIVAVLTFLWVLVIFGFFLILFSR